ncbi:MGH1-like glycoside hydrolase domain-containing protein [Paenibacillus albus]|uniref:Alpha-L-rhamnosidase six-hairpin glycosidase domain-containing protein n=1 Tax=Paenibacillus albus TaxID=2495582 RepID=A0A3Q8X7D0_9BACL|nr:glycosyl hydrolase family 65 protein [Paenibacillus albus]AZN41712.1 hypothetical protein EJC50_20065 [Paenibacillus albus]
MRINLSFLQQDESDWMKEQVPLFECPEENLQRTYYFRWGVFRKHLKLTQSGYVVTEFLPQVPWSGRHNTISCPAGHHFYEGRWLHQPVYLNDYAEFWFRKGGEPRRYSFWAADAIFAHYLVTGDSSSIRELLPDLVANYEAWEAERKDASGLYWQMDDRDGMEFSIGGSGLRPTINSYMYADAVAISRIAMLAGQQELAQQYEDNAAVLQQLVERLLWDEEAKFFKVRTNMDGLAYTRKLTGGWLEQLPDDLLQENKLMPVCELTGYVPWCFGLPSAGYEDAWARLMDPKQFYAPYGPTTAEQAHPLFMAELQHECLWNGPSWPFATTQTLVAMARLLREYKQPHVNRADYYHMLCSYANSHQRMSEDGTRIPWIDENLDPFTGEWIARSKLHARDDANKDRGADYNHSAFCDLIISGLIGMQPRAGNELDIHPLIPEEANWDYFCLENVFYHKHYVTVVYDKDGERYGKGSGYRIEVDGKLRYHADRIQPATVLL